MYFIKVMGLRQKNQGYVLSKEYLLHILNIILKLEIVSQRFPIEQRKYFGQTVSYISGSQFFPASSATDLSATTNTINFNAKETVCL